MDLLNSLQRLLASGYSPAKIATYAKNSRDVASFNAAALAVVAYDLFLSADRELELIWKSRWSTVKVLYIVCRLHGVIILTANFLATFRNLCLCRLYFGWTIMCGPLAQSLLVNVIELIRLNALYQRNRFFQISAAIAFIAKLVIGYICSVLILRDSFRTLVLPYDWGIRMGGCGVILAPTPPFIICLITLLMQFFLFSLMMYRVLEAVIQERRDGSRAMFSPLFSMFFKSGAVWFGASSVAAVLFIVFFQGTEGPRQTFGVSWVVVAQTLSGTRLILDLRSCSRKDFMGTKEVDHALELLALEDERLAAEQSNQKDTEDPSPPVPTPEAGHSQGEHRVADQCGSPEPQVPIPSSSLPHPPIPSSSAA